MYLKTCFLVVLCLALAVPAFAAQDYVKVVAVADGNTITVLRNELQVRARLYGIDCPKKGQAFGNRAKQATVNAVHGVTVAIQQIAMDRYDSIVAVVLTPEGESLNEILVRDGLAWVYPQYCKHEDICAPLRRLAAEAKAARRGLWRDKDPVPPWEWRKAKRYP